MISNNRWHRGTSISLRFVPFHTGGGGPMGSAWRSSIADVLTDKIRVSTRKGKANFKSEKDLMTLPLVSHTATAKWKLTRSYSLQLSERLPHHPFKLPTFPLLVCDLRSVPSLVK